MIDYTFYLNSLESMLDSQRTIRSIPRLWGMDKFECLMILDELESLELIRKETIYYKLLRGNIATFYRYNCSKNYKVYDRSDKARNQKLRMGLNVDTPCYLDVVWGRADMPDVDQEVVD